MSDIQQYIAPIKFVELDLSKALQRIANGEEAPLVQKNTGPIEGGLCDSTIKAIGQRAKVTGDIYAPNTMTLFSSGEDNIVFDKSVAGHRVFVFLTYPSIEDTKTSPELFRAVSALTTANYEFIAQQVGYAAKHAGAVGTVLFEPNFAYARQDKTHKQRAPITAALSGRNLIAYYDNITCLHLHSPAIEGMLDPGSITNISPNEIFAPGFVCRDPETLNPIGREALTAEGVNKLFGKLCIVSPDAGGMANARDFAKYCKTWASTILDVAPDQIVDIPLAAIDKRRPAANVAEVMDVLGKENVKGRVAEMFDDMGDTFHSAIHGAEALRKVGAESVRFTSSHGYFSGDALERLLTSPIDRVTVTNSMSLRPAVLNHPKINVVDIGPVLAQVVADRTILPPPNVVFDDRHIDHDPVRREKLGRYAEPMLQKAAL